VLFRPPSTLLLFHLGADLVAIDQFSALGGSVTFIDLGAILGPPRVSAMEQLQRP
jgi:hypothetical protein